MNASLPLAALAADPFQVGRPLFGNQWLALLAASGLIALLLLAVALLGRWLAATHPAPPVKVAATSVAVVPPPVTGAAANTVASVGLVNSDPVLTGDVPHELVPVIIAAVAASLGAGVRVTAIRPFVEHPVATPSLEALMQQWSYEGRRQIYSSHKVR